MDEIPWTVTRWTSGTPALKNLIPFCAGSSAIRVPQDAVQAIFSVIAIVAAGGFSWALMRSDRSFRAKERIAQTENLLVTVAGDVFPLFGAIQRLKGHIASLHDRPPVVGDTRDHLRRLTLNISERLDEAMPLAIDMDAAVIDPLRQTVMSATAYNSFLADLIGAWPFDPAEWPNAMDQLEANRLMVEDYAQQLVNRYLDRAK
jgi:hypothetical protein